MAEKLPIDALCGLSESELLAIRATLVSALTGGTAGTDITSTSTRDLTVSFGVAVRPEVMLLAVSYALWKLKPSLYTQPESTKAKRYYTL